LKKILELNRNPILTSYWFYANLQSVITVADPKNLFIANNYNNIFSLTLNTRIQPHVLFTSEIARTIMDIYFDCPYLDLQKINKNYFFGICKFSFLDFVKHTINEGYFILLMVDRCYIKEYGFDYPSNHEIMIYGYDEEVNIVYFCDNVKDGEYRNNLSCSFSALLASFQELVFPFKLDDKDGTVDPFFDCLYLLKPRENSFYTLNLDEIIRSLRQYIHLEASFGEKTIYSYKTVWGIHVYETFKKYLHYVSGFNGSNYIKDIRGFSVLWDHKKSVLTTFKILCEYGYLSENVITAYEVIEKKILVLRNKVLKMIYSDNKKCIPKLIDNINEISEQEFLIISSALRF